jgi:hypothetical protein
MQVFRLAKLLGEDDLVHKVAIPKNKETFIATLQYTILL